MITSKHNPLIKKIRREEKKGKLGLLEGKKVVLEALQAGVSMDHLLLDGKRYPDLPKAFLPFQENVSWHRISPSLSQELSLHKVSSGIFGVVPPPHWNWADITKKPGPVILLDGLQDPGNVGTLVRSALAFDASGVIALLGSCRLFQRRVLHASRGALLQLPFLERVSFDAVRENLPEHPIFLLDPHGDGIYPWALPEGPLVLVVGSEARGSSLDLPDKVRVPTVHVESLNAAMAVTVVLYTLFWRNVT